MKASLRVNSAAAKDRCRFPLSNTHRAINGLIGALIVGSAVLAKAALHAGALDELQLVSQLPSDLIAQCQASAAEEGLFGNNQGAIQALLPKVHRAMDYLTQYGPTQL